MIQNWWVLVFNSVYENYPGNFQVCTECGECNLCEGCIECSNDCPDCPRTEEYIFWVASATPGWSCEAEIDPYCETGTPLWTCEKRGEAGGCVSEFWDWHVDLVCGGIGQQGWPRTITNFGYTKRGMWAKDLEPPPGPHPCQCLPATPCGTNFEYVNNSSPEDTWNWRMPCRGPCNAGCSDCGNQGCYYFNNDIFDEGCQQDCRCAFGVGNGPALQNEYERLAGSHFLARSTKYEMVFSQGCDPKFVEEYPNDNGPDLMIGNHPVSGIPCGDFPAGNCATYGISNVLPRGQANTDGDFYWENMRFTGYEPTYVDSDTQIVCAGTEFYEVVVTVPCGETSGNPNGCPGTCGCADTNCGAMGKFLYYSKKTDEGVTFIQIGKYTSRPRCSRYGLSPEESNEVSEINSMGGYAVHFSGGIPTENSPTLTTSACVDLSPKQFSFNCGS